MSHPKVVSQSLGSCLSLALNLRITVKPPGACKVGRAKRIETLSKEDEEVALSVTFIFLVRALAVSS
ncbi:hypothetical protein DMENIID0001_049770 [Sergentomyia squamirostris]